MLLLRNMLLFFIIHTKGVQDRNKIPRGDWQGDQLQVDAPGKSAGRPQ
jgi:hypothetical protein